MRSIRQTHGDRKASKTGQGVVNQVDALDFRNARGCILDVIYDISRLSTRSLNATPNGIDWIDSLLADHFCGQRPGHALLFGFHGPSLFRPGKLPMPTDLLARAWGWVGSDQRALLPQSLVDALTSAATGRASSRAPSGGLAQVRRIARSFTRYALSRGADPRTSAPHGAIYLNATHYPLERAAHVAWLDARPDVLPALYVHDVLPVTAPEWFWPGEPERHGRRLAFLARRGAAALVGSRAVEQALKERMRALGRTDLPIHAAHPPVLPLFHQPVAPDPRLAYANYFVICGTIEPRKNHQLLVEVWRRLVRSQGAKAPRLVVVGKRGWKCDAILADLHDPELAGFVIEASNLTSDAYRMLLASARALLSPSLAEGYGLPLAEALAAGVPAIVSDIPAHREQGSAGVLFLDPRNKDNWIGAVEAYSAIGSAERGAAMAELSNRLPVDQRAYFISLDGFFEGLTR